MVKYLAAAFAATLISRANSRMALPLGTSKLSPVLGLTDD